MVTAYVILTYQSVFKCLFVGFVGIFHSSEFWFVVTWPYTNTWLMIPLLLICDKQQEHVSQVSADSRALSSLFLSLLSSSLHLMLNPHTPTFSGLHPHTTEAAAVLHSLLFLHVSLNVWIDKSWLRNRIRLRWKVQTSFLFTKSPQGGSGWVKSRLWNKTVVAGVRARHECVQLCVGVRVCAGEVERCCK